MANETNDDLKIKDFNWIHPEITDEQANTFIKEYIEAATSVSQGEWNTEPDELDFKYKDYECHIRRGILKNLCGYVRIPVTDSWIEEYDWETIDVHGGITYDEIFEHQDTKEKHRVIGFDCGHLNDTIPWHEDIYNRTTLFKEIENKYPSRNLFKRTYKNINFVKKEIRKMVRQIIKIKENK